MRYRRLKKSHFYLLLLDSLTAPIALVLEKYTSSVLITQISLLVAATVSYSIIIYEQLEQYIKQQREIARQRISIMMLKMRPHFIYNTMMTIYYLCAMDPAKAQMVTLEFTTYLRKNFNAISSEKLIPFIEELEHTRAYLAVEKAQYEDLLFVDYDTPCTRFCMPPLTLQPIVENAVKHGMNPDGAPLHILIRTRKTDSGSETIVENTGVCFYFQEGTGTHATLSNIKQRLELMCGGKLKIAPSSSGGTVVTITIPDNNQRPDRE